MLNTERTSSTPKKPAKRHRQVEAKDYLLDHLECASLLSRQRQLPLTTSLIDLSIETLAAVSRSKRD